MNIERRARIFLGIICSLLLIGIGAASCTPDPTFEYSHCQVLAFPEDIGRFVAFVVSEPAWHLNGAHLRIDGGAADAVT